MTDGLERAFPVGLLGLEETLPRRECPGCGEPMTRGNRILLGDQPVLTYTHERRCLKLLRRNYSADALNLHERLLAQTLAEAAIPAVTLGRDELPAATLSDYQQAFVDSCAPGGSHHEALRRAGQLLRFVRQERRLPRTGLLFEGGVGSGKTTLMALLARELVHAYDVVHSLRWHHVPELASRLRAASRSDRFTAEFRELCGAPILVLDDLGGEEPSPWWVNEVLAPLLETRATAAADSRRLLLVTTRFDPDALALRWREARSARGTEAAQADRVISRLCAQCCWVRVETTDLRLPGEPEWGNA